MKDLKIGPAPVRFADRYLLGGIYPAVVTVPPIPLPATGRGQSH